MAPDSSPSQAPGPLAALMRRVLRTGLLAVVLKASSAVLALFTAWALTRLLSPAEFGVYSYVIALASIVASVASIGVPGLFIREVAILRSREHWGELRGLVRWGLGVAGTSLVLGGGALVVVGRAIDRGDLRASWADLGLGAAAALLLGAISVLGSILRGSQRVMLGLIPDLLVRYGVFAAVLVALLIAGSGLSTTEALRWQLLAAGSGALVSLLLLLRHPPTPASAASETPLYRWRGWLASAIGMSLAGVVITVNSQIDVVMMKALSSAADTGVYTIASRLASALLFLLFAANAALPPVIAPLWAQGARERVERVLAISTVAILGVALVASAVLLFIRHEVLATIGPEYAGAAAVLGTLAIANTVAVAAGPVQQTLIMVGQERAFAITAILPTLLNVGLNFVLIPRYGPQGAAWATSAAIVAQALLQSTVLRWRTGIAPPMAAILRAVWTRFLRRAGR